MPDEPSPSPAKPLLWLGSSLVVAVGVLATISYSAAEEANAAPGSPLYGRAVHEAMQGLSGKPQQPAAGQPPLPAGVSAHEVYWCAQCKAYHKREPAVAEPPMAAADDVPAAIARLKASARLGPAVRPPIPAGFSEADVYWCENCKTYHQRQAKGATPTPGPTPQMTPVEQGTAARPPIPEGLTADQVTWCENCKAYHRRDAQPPPAPAAPVEGSGP